MVILDRIGKSALANHNKEIYRSLKISKEINQDNIQQCLLKSYSKDANCFQ
jgi:hypothetical protein